MNSKILTLDGKMDKETLAQLLCSCRAFRGVNSLTLSRQIESIMGKLSEDESLHISVVEKLEGEIIVNSGDHMKNLIFIRSGVVGAWQVPVSKLTTPYLFGEHEISAGMTYWMATYSALTDTQLIYISVTLMEKILKALPIVKENILDSLLHRLSRYYWTSLATNGDNVSKVAAALVSRLALRNLDFSKQKNIDLDISQREICRLTNTSRPGVAQGLRKLHEDGVIQLRDPKYMTGVIIISDVDLLKETAFKYFREKFLPLYQGSEGRTSQK